MTSPVDFKSTFSEWTQAKKWNGTFQVRWWYVKDILNKVFKSIPNKLNENKPVTNSRDTQEVPLREGIRMLEIFRDYQETTSIFNDIDTFSKGKSKQQSKL
jgi:YTH domain-containing family protein